MRKCLVDAGPLVALFDRSEAKHQDVKAVLRRGNDKLFTSWMSVAEVGHLLSFDVRAQTDFLTWLGAGGATLVDLSVEDLFALGKLVQKYQDVPMDFADGALVILSERLGIKRVLTFDADFYVYRAYKKHAFEFVM